MTPASPARRQQAQRQPCTCEPVDTRRMQACPACVAWDKKRVLLTDGTLVKQTDWLLAHEAPGTHKEKS